MKQRLTIEQIDAMVTRALDRGEESIEVNAQILSDLVAIAKNVKEFNRRHRANPWGEICRPIRDGYCTCGAEDVQQALHNKGGDA